MIDFNFRKQYLDSTFTPYKVEFLIKNGEQDKILRQIIKFALDGVAPLITQHASCHAEDLKELLDKINEVITA